MRLSCVLILCCLALQPAFAELDYKQLAATKRDQPPVVTTTEAAKFPIQFGEMAIPKNSTVKLLSISPEGVLSIEYNGQKYSVPAAKTDLEKRVTEIRSHRIVIGGMEYQDFSFSNPTVTEVEMKHSRGVERIALSNLPPEWQKKLGYDPEKEAALIKEEHKAQQEAAKKAEIVVKKRQAQDEKDAENAYYASRNYIKGKLKSPSSADFSNLITDKGTTGWLVTDDRQFKCWGMVDAKNVFGTMLRQKWQTVVLPDGDKLLVVYASIGEQVILDVRDKYKTAAKVKAESFIGMNKPEMENQMGKPVKTKREKNADDGDFTIYIYSEEKGKETFFTIWDSDGKIDSGMYQGVLFNKR